MGFDAIDINLISRVFEAVSRRLKWFLWEYDGCFRGESRISQRRMFQSILKLFQVGYGVSFKMFKESKRMFQR